MTIGIRISPLDTDKFEQICSALENANIDYSVWNVEAILDPFYNGPIDLCCDCDRQWDDFIKIVNSFVAKTMHVDRT